MSDGQELPEEFKKKIVETVCGRPFFNSGYSVSEAIRNGTNFLAVACDECMQKKCDIREKS